MRDALIGYTGFVGSHLTRQRTFERFFNSGNIEEIRGQSFDLVVCAGVRAEKWLANKEPEKDWQGIQTLLSHLEQVQTKEFVLISTIDVYPNSVGVDENTLINPEIAEPYGKHRYYVETFVREHFAKHHILRLPALFGQGLKKNFIYDLMHPEPKFIMAQKFGELLTRLTTDEQDFLKQYYTLDANGNYFLNQPKDTATLDRLRAALKKSGFTSMVFTDQDSEFQFYDLEGLWEDIEKTRKNNISLLNVSTEPLTTKALAKEVFGLEFANKTSKPPLKYNMQSIHAGLFGGRHGYLYTQADIIQRMRTFAEHAQ